MMLPLVPRARLKNPRNLCFVNSNLLSFLWATTQCRDTETFWGNYHDSFWGFLHSTFPHRVNAVDMERIDEIIADWTATTGASITEQGDAGEFTVVMLRHIQPQNVNLCWQKRVEHANGDIEIDDRCDLCIPLIVQFDPSILGQDSINLQDLIMTWHGRDGMVVALTQEASLACIQIDRWADIGEFRNRIPSEIVPTYC